MVNIPGLQFLLVELGDLPASVRKTGVDLSLFRIREVRFDVSEFLKVGLYPAFEAKRGEEKIKSPATCLR